MRDNLGVAFDWLSAFICSGPGSFFGPVNDTCISISLASLPGDVRQVMELMQSDAHWRTLLEHAANLALAQAVTPPGGPQRLATDFLETILFSQRAVAANRWDAAKDDIVVLDNDQSKKFSSPPLPLLSCLHIS